MALGSRAPTRREDHGFTLIELLVVIIIIGILAAVAIPIFLNQRTKGYNAAAKSDLRAVAEFQEVYLYDQGTYATLAAIVADGNTLRITDRVRITVERYDGSNGYCLSARHLSSGDTWYWDSLAGGMLAEGAAGCPVATTGVPGDSLTG